MDKLFDVMMKRQMETPDPQPRTAGELPPQRTGGYEFEGRTVGGGPIGDQFENGAPKRRIPTPPPGPRPTQPLSPWDMGLTHFTNRPEPRQEFPFPPTRFPRY